MDNLNATSWALESFAISESKVYSGKLTYFL